MGSLKVTVCTSVLAAVALAPTAYAADDGTVSVAPAAPAPGSDVTLRVTGCAQRTAVAASAAFVADARLTITGARELAGESRVRSTAEAGSYAVRITCGATTRTGTLTVREGGAARPGAASLPVPAGGQRPAHGDVGHQPLDRGGRQPAPEGGGQPSAPGAEEETAPSHRPGAPASPVAPVRAGGGGAAELIAAEERGAGPGAAQGVTGLVLAGVAAAVIVMLRRGVRRGRGTD
ncbi:hypothetical protein [Streptomyces paradoxus]|uniref:hypothetical protein n=1 Tax=Streptomyces paradoxus TaxID=66375 RepID=UPI0037D5945E